MRANAESAKGQLLQGIERGISLPLQAQRFPAPGPNVRNSAVLVLFGELDRVPARDRVAAPGQEPAHYRAAEFPSASTAPLQVAADLDILLTRRSNGLRNHAGQIAFPGGGVESFDEDRPATALREAYEETGLDPNGVDVLGTLPDAHIPVSNYLVTPVIAWWRSPSEVAADAQESVQVFRVPVAELLDPASRGTSVLRAPGQTFRGPAFQLGPQFGGHVVWGFTAMLLDAIFTGVGWAVPCNSERIFEVAR